MSPDQYHSHPVTRLSEARRQYADSKKPFQRLRALTRSAPKGVRTGSSDWGTDEVGSFCTPGAEEYTWNTGPQLCNRYGVMIDSPATTGANDDEEQRENPVVRKHVQFAHPAAVESESQSGSDGEGWGAWRRRRLVRVERCVLRLRKDFCRLACGHGRSDMGLDGDGYGRWLLGGIDDEEGEDADDEGAGDSDVGGRPRFGRLGARLQIWQRKVKGGVRRGVDHFGSRRASI